MQQSDPLKLPFWHVNPADQTRVPCAGPVASRLPLKGATVAQGSFDDCTFCSACQAVKPRRAHHCRCRLTALHHRIWLPNRAIMCLDPAQHVRSVQALPDLHHGPGPPLHLPQQLRGPGQPAALPALPLLPDRRMLLHPWPVRRAHVAAAARCGAGVGEVGPSPPWHYSSQETISNILRSFTPLLWR